MVSADIKTIKNKIPSHCFEKNTFTSMYYFFRDVFIIGILYLLYPHINNILLKVLWWNLTGFFMWCLFLIGHDCGHDSFSESEILNEIIGHITHIVNLK
jgi:omega-3 fatty acid desaturase (delta-15 desaturase)